MRNGIQIKKAPCTKTEEDAAANALAARFRGEEEQDEEDDRRKDGESLELAREVRRGALLDRAGDLLHSVSAFTGGENLPNQDCCYPEGGKRDDGNNDDCREVASGQLDQGSPALPACCAAGIMG